ncbi:MAG: hypothetical protein EXR78_05155 [Deltaproteobacteria bacterium]|nr:hypothetical protein [Deltaproteobacteria bacterium]
MSIRVLDPTFEEARTEQSVVTGLKSLVDCTVGLLDNSKIKVKDILDTVETLLRTQHGVKHIVRLKKSDASRPAAPEVVAAMAGCDAVISAVGD